METLKTIQHLKMVVLYKEYNSFNDFLFDITFFNGKLIVIHFSATWCPPCARMQKCIDDLSAADFDLVFFKIDVDKNEQLCKHLGISAMPTFQFWKNGERVEDFTGADEAKLKEVTYALQ